MVKMDTVELSFSDALVSLKNGYKIARKGWNGKGMYIFLNGRTGSKNFDDPTVVTTMIFEPCIVMFTADRKFQPGWLASQADILAEDWEVV